MRIRPATPADIPGMRQLEAQAGTAAHWTEEQYQSLFSPEPRRIALVFDNDGVQGFVVGRQIGPEWELENIVIGERGRGYGFLLLHVFLIALRIHGGEAVFLEVRASNAAARHLYEKHGFTETGRRRIYYLDPQEDAILYRKDLTALKFDP